MARFPLSVIDFRIYFLFLYLRVIFYFSLSIYLFYYYYFFPLDMYCVYRFIVILARSRLNESSTHLCNVDK